MADPAPEPNLNFRYHTEDYRTGLVGPLRIMLARDSPVEFISRNGKDYATITLINADDQALVCHMVRHTLYLPALGLAGGPIYHLSDFNDFDDDDHNSINLGYSSNYRQLTKKLQEKTLFTIDYRAFAAAVDFLIAQMSEPHVATIDKSGWRASIFHVIKALAEGGRFSPISVAHATSQISNEPSTINWQWVKLVLRNWSTISASARQCAEPFIRYQDLTRAERDMLWASKVRGEPGSYDRHLSQVKASLRVCRVMVVILCNYLD